jgi:hypothetical protein
MKSRRAHRQKAICGRQRTIERLSRNEVLRRTGFRAGRCAAIAIILALCPGSFAANWESTVTKEPAGNFPELRPLRATYRFGWSGFTAATGEVHFKKLADNKFQLDGTGRTIGLVRWLWKLDVNYRAVANAQTLRPIETRQTESYHAKTITTQLNFTNNGVTSIRTEDHGGAINTKTRKFGFPSLFDLNSALLYLRSQPLNDRSSYRVVVYPGTNAYLATITMLGRDKISVRAGTYNAIKLDLQLSRVGKHLDLEPHRKFRRAKIWVSDDANRILLLIEAQIFVGTVFAELQSVSFSNP